MNLSTDFDKRQLRNVFGTFTTGVTIVTTRGADGKAHGVTANSFSSVSLEPPLVLWSQALTSKSHAAFMESEHFVVNILADDQVAISNQFAKSADDKFAGIRHSDGIGGTPVIEGSAAHLECTKVATYPGGDHVVYIGRVERIGHSHRRPLAFAGGRYAVPFAHELSPVATRLPNAKAVAMPALKRAIVELARVADEVGQHSLCLSVWGNHGPTALYWEASSRPVSDHLQAGIVMSVTNSAAGRAFCAFLPIESTRHFIDEDLRLYRTQGEDATSQKAAFDAEIELTRRQGMARVIDPPHASLLHKIPTIAFAAPIFDASGAMVMALSMIAPVDRLDPAWSGAAPSALLAAADQLSGRDNAA